MIVAITGGTGFIGQRLAAHHLAAGDTVRILTRSDVRCPREGEILYHGDLTDPGFDPQEFLDGADLLYHCAGELRDKPRMRATHVEGTRRLLDAFPGTGRWVQLSSVGAYGPRRSGVVLETDEPKPVGEYEKTKTEADALVIEAGVRGLDYVILRPSNVFGAHMPNHSLTQMARMVKKGLFFYIGRPGTSANYVHVDNVVDALIRCARTPAARGRIYIVSDWCDLETLVATLSRLMSCRMPILRLPEPLVRVIVSFCSAIPRFPLTLARVDALTVRSHYSTENLERELGYHTLVSLEDGLKEMLSSYGLVAETRI